MGVPPGDEGMPIGSPAEIPGTATCSMKSNFYDLDLAAVTHEPMLA